MNNFVKILKIVFKVIIFIIGFIMFILGAGVLTYLFIHQ